MTQPDYPVVMPQADKLHPHLELLISFVVP